MATISCWNLLFPPRNSTESVFFRPMPGTTDFFLFDNDAARPIADQNADVSTLGDICATWTRGAPTRVVSHLCCSAFARTARIAPRIAPGRASSRAPRRLMYSCVPRRVLVTIGVLMNTHGVIGRQVCDPMSIITWRHVHVSDDAADPEIRLVVESVRVETHLLEVVRHRSVCHRVARQTIRPDPCQKRRASTLAECIGRQAQSAKERYVIAQRSALHSGHQHGR